ARLWRSQIALANPREGAVAPSLGPLLQVQTSRLAPRPDLLSLPQGERKGRWLGRKRPPTSVPGVCGFLRRCVCPGVSLPLRERKDLRDSGAARSLLQIQERGLWHHLRAFADSPSPCAATPPTPSGGCGTCCGRTACTASS